MGDDYRKKVDIYKQDGKYYLEGDFDVDSAEKSIRDKTKDVNSSENEEDLEKILDII